MVSLTLRGLRARKLRAALTGLAVMLGVMMISGTYVFTDTINKTFDDIFQQGSKGVSAVLQSRTAFTVDGGQPPPFSASVLPQVKKVAGVQVAAGSISDTASIFLANGKQVKTQGAPSILVSTVPKRFDPLRYVSGAPPTAGDQAAIDKGTADKKNLKVGDTIKLAGKAPAQTFKVSGIAKYGDIDSLGGATIAIVTLPEAQHIAQKEGELDQIQVGAEPGVNPGELVGRISQAVPPSIDVETGEKNAKDQAQDIEDNLSFLKYLLLAFGIIALFVGAFIIFNTFSITVAQRTKEFALLRMMGASARQVRRSVLLEALIIGLFASVVGCAAGVLIAKGIDQLFKAFGADLPQQGTVVQSRTIIVAVAVGVIVTLVSGLLPARRATRVLPLAAIREEATQATGKQSVLRIVITTIVVALGLLLVISGLFFAEGTSAVLGSLGVGAALLFVGVALLASRLVRPLASFVGLPLQALRGMEGQLARENAMRNPSRTATTSAALMIGLALVTFVTVLAAGLNASITDALDNNFKAELVLENSNGAFNPTPPAAGVAVRKVPGVQLSSPLKSTQAKVETGNAGTTQVSGVDPATIGEVWTFDFEEGAPSLAGLALNQVMLDSTWAKDHKFKTGDPIRLEASNGTKTDFTVAGTVDIKNSPFGKILVTNAASAKFLEQRNDQYVMLRTAPGADVKNVQKAVNVLLKAQFPTVESKTQSEFKDQLVGQVTQFVTLLYALLSLSIIVSLFGIVNTLVLSISERTREIGMMRAIGTSRRQVRRIVRYEAVITALIGAVLGLILGLILGLLTTIALSSEGFVVSIPFVSLVEFMILAALAGILAAIPPARRASRLNPLEALSYE